jgi:hypothetical protein
MAVSAAHGLIWGEAGMLAEAATAPVELTNIEPATKTPTNRFTRTPIWNLPNAKGGSPPRISDNTLSELKFQ